MGSKIDFFLKILKKGVSKIEMFFPVEKGGSDTAEPTHHPHMMSTLSEPMTTRSLPLSETDPDTNYFNQIEDCNRMSCNYLREDDFIKWYKSDKLENSFSLFHVNIRSLNSKLLSLTAYLNTLQKEFKIIGLSETWLNEQNKADAKIRYYNAIHSCRDTLSRGGGVNLYIHESMDFKERSDLSVVNENIESCFVEIPKGTAAMNSDVIVGVIYRPQGKVLICSMNN